jgi:uncharacterized protein YdhG (YjbR/CyaY superfamily)
MDPMKKNPAGDSQRSTEAKKLYTIAGYKKHVGLYPHPTTMEHFEKQLTKYRRGKGSVQFPVDSELPKELIIDMITYRKKLITVE